MPTPDYKKQAYMLINLALAIPLLLWPILLQTGLSPAFGTDVFNNWNVAACCLLIAIVIADSVLTGTHSYTQTLQHALWIILIIASVSLSLRTSSGSYLLALLFIIHSLRSAVPMWQDRAVWWHRIAWVRDVLTASIMLYWLTHWPSY
ncbi:MAG: hypothetical protein R8K22_05730 [Mariprofundaceae bacterium]